MSAERRLVELGVAAIRGLDPGGALRDVPRLLETVCDLTGMGCANLAYVTDEGWTACASRASEGLTLAAGAHIPGVSTVCHEAYYSRSTITVEDAANDDRYRDHDILKSLGVRSVVTSPVLLADGGAFGTLCAYSLEPREISKATVAAFEMMARMLGNQIDAAMRLQHTEGVLRSELELSGIREQFISILGHDLRNPIAAVMGAARMLRRDDTPTSQAKFLPMIDRSAKRMMEMVNNLVDMTRLRMGSGIRVERADTCLSDALHHLVDETRLAHPGRVVEADIELPDPIYCDGARLSQLVSNLMGNAIQYGSPAYPVVLCASMEGELELRVVNGGEITSDVMGRLFKPYERGGEGQGLGLGLFIASEIARAHGGVLSVTSTCDKTTFTCRVPLTPSDPEAGVAVDTEPMMEDS